LISVGDDLVEVKNRTRKTRGCARDFLRRAIVRLKDSAVDIFQVGGGIFFQVFATFGAGDGNEVFAFA
jgi:hypothetical protein